MYQQELARSGETLFKLRGEYLICVVISSHVGLGTPGVASVVCAASVPLEKEF